VADTGDVWFVPALTGLGAPQWDPFARGTLLGITRGTTRAHVARAALESIAFLTRDVVEAMRAHSGLAIEELRADGGAVSNTFLMQFQADILGLPVDVPEQIESTSLGSAFLAGLAVGVWSDRHDLDRVRTTGHRYEPAMDADERDFRYRRWLRALRRSLDWAGSEE
jgi:glycerol kinase